MIDGPGGFVSDLLESCPDQEGAGNMVALDSSLAALALFDAAELLDFSRQLLDLPAAGARFPCLNRGLASLVVGDNMIRPVC